MSEIAYQQELDPDLAVKSLFKDQTCLSKAAIGATLNLISFIIFMMNPLMLPFSFCLWALTTGYALRYQRMIISNRAATLPDWNEWMDLFISGMSWLAVVTGFLFALWTLTATSLLIGATIGAIKTSSTYFVYWTGGTLVGITAIFFLGNLFVSTLMANFAQQENMRSAVAWFKVGRRISAKPRNFICAWMIGLGLQTLAIVIPVATVIGVIMLPTVIFLAQMLSAAMMGQAWAACEPADAIEVNEEATVELKEDSAEIEKES